MIHWRDGEFREGGVTLSLDGEAFRFGTGLFETIRFNGRQLCHLQLHLDRLHGSLENLSLKHIRLEPGRVAGIVDGLLDRTALAGRPARINIYCFPDASPKAPCSVVITAREAVPPPDSLKLTLWPESHLSPLARHKSMNYAFQAMALQQAKAAGADGALLTDLEGRLLETCTSALVLRRGDALVTPASQPRLASTALAVAGSVLRIEKQVIHKDELPRFDHVYALNAMIGMRPVTAIDELAYAPDTATSDLASKAILGD